MTHTEYRKYGCMATYIIPVLLLAANGILKMLYLDAAPIAGDEPFSIYHAQMRVPAIIELLSKGNNPPLFEILLHYWIKIFGISPFSVRFLPMIFSAFTAVVIYRIGLRYFKFPVAVCAALLFTLSNYHLALSHETRSYSLFCLLSALSLLYFFHIQYRKQEKIKYIVMLGIINALLIYTHFFGFFILFIQLLCTLTLRPYRNYALKYVFLSFLLTAILYVPYGGYFFSRFTDSISQGTWVPVVGWDEAYHMIVRFANKPLTAILFLLMMAGGLAALIVQKFSPVPAPGIIVTIWFFLPFCLMFMFSHKDFSWQIPMFMDRYLVYITPAFYLLIALATAEISRYARVIWLLPVAGMLATFTPKIQMKEPVDLLVNKIRELKNADDVVIISPEWFDLAFTYYYNREWFTETDDSGTKTRIRDHLASQHIYPLSYATEIRQDEMETGKVIFLDAASESAVPGNGVRDFLNRKFGHEEMIEFPGAIHIFVYRE